jgi:predicted  nucleic acid-binding Zn-ribbon protein
MDWKDLEKMTVLKLREEALKHPDIKGVHGKSKPQLMDELAGILGIEKPHVHFAEKVIHTKGDLKHTIHQLKTQRDKLIAAKDRKAVHEVRRQIHKLKHRIRKIERESA